MVPFLAALTVFACVFLIVLAFGVGQPTARSRLDSLRRNTGDGGPQTTMMERMVSPMTHGGVEAVQNILPASMLDGMRRDLVVAGEPMTLHAFVLMRLIVLGVCVAFPGLLFLSGTISFTLIGIGIAIAFLAVGLLLPQMWLSQRIGQRQHTITKSLPDAFDLITTCVEAGLGLDAALGRVAEKVQGPFADELSRTLQEISLGRLRRDALFELGERTAVPDIITFVNAVIQAERMGTSIGTVLRVQAEQLRVRRRQRAEAQAYKAPVKMIFPLVLCIFPTLFIVILGPAVITILQDFPT